MKMKLLFAACLLLCINAAIQAQGGPGMPRMSVPERVKMVMDKLADFKLDKEKTALTDSAFTVYYKDQEKAMEDMRASGQFDRDKMMETRKKLTDERDDKLKKIFSADQFKKWKEEIEPSMRPQRPAGGGGPGGNNQ
jgi:hypothetical protein